MRFTRLPPEVLRLLHWHTMETPSAMVGLNGFHDVQANAILLRVFRTDRASARLVSFRTPLWSTDTKAIPILSLCPAAQSLDTVLSNASQNPFLNLAASFCRLFPLVSVNAS